MPVSKNRKKNQKKGRANAKNIPASVKVMKNLSAKVEFQRFKSVFSDAQKPKSRMQGFLSRSQIQYTLVTEGENHELGDFFQTSLAILRELPTDLLQLRDPAEHYKRSNDLIIRKGLDIFSLPASLFSGSTEQALNNFIQYSKVFNEDLIKVFIIDSEIQSHGVLAECTKNIPFSYIALAGELDEKLQSLYDQNNIFTNGHQFIELIKRDLDLINSELSQSHGISISNFEYLDYQDLNDKNPFYNMDVTNTNYFSLNQIWGNFWKKRPPFVPFEDRNIEQDKRVDFQLAQINQFDNFRFFMHPKPRVTPIEPWCAPMIIIAPYHFPNYPKLTGQTKLTKEEKQFFRFTQIEQEKNYTYSIDEANFELLKNPLFGSAATMTARRLVILDGLAYLHAQFNHSPVFRFPIIGKSINMDLSHLQQPIVDKKKTMSKMLGIGEKLSNHFMSESFSNLLSKRNGQLVAISDLPIEWTKLQKYPLAMTHDICKLPEFNYNSLLNTYIQNQRISFTIGSDIVEKTLVIHCASDDDHRMHHLFGVIDDQKKNFPFQSVICKTVQEIAEAVKRLKPHFLIFDCHGGFNEKNLSSFLIVDAKKKIFLTGDDIINYEISAPLVFISACSTMPNYGYVKFISDAFLQAGAISVTATYLPIKAIDATVLIVRLINNLNQHRDKIFHSNWLAFICHTLRGVLVHESIRNQQFKKMLPENIDHEKIASFITDLMVFDRRERTFDSLLEFIKGLNPEIQLSFEDLSHEWLSYTTIGRADLIYFENWIEKHQRKSLGEVAYDDLFTTGAAYRTKI